MANQPYTQFATQFLQSTGNKSDAKNPQKNVYKKIYCKKEAAKINAIRALTQIVPESITTTIRPEWLMNG